MISGAEDRVYSFIIPDSTDPLLVSMPVQTGKSLVGENRTWTGLREAGTREASFNHQLSFLYSDQKFGSTDHIWITIKFNPSCRVPTWLNPLQKVSENGKSL